MSEPIVFISHFRVKEDRSDHVPDLSNQIARAMEAGRPRTLGFLFYVNEDRSQMSIVHVFPDAESMDLHFVGADQRSSAAY